MKYHNKTRIILNVLFYIAQISAFIGLLRNGKYDYIYGVVVTTVFYLLITCFESKFMMRVSNYTRGAIAVSIVSHNLLGQYFGLYLTSATFDRIQHIFGTYSFTLYFYSFLSQKYEISTVSKLSRFIYAVSLGIALGAILEIIEFLVDSLFKPQIPNQPSLTDTDLDLISDVVGSFVAAFHLTRAKINSLTVRKVS